MNKIIKYKLENVDCASCAAKIEKGLLQKDGVKYAAINFSNLTLETDLNDIEEVKSTINKIEPEVEVYPLKVKKVESKFSKKKEIIKFSLIVLVYLSALWLNHNYGNESQPPYTGNNLLINILFISTYLFSGWGVLSKAVKNIFKGNIFDENFLMTIATLGAIAINAIPEAAAVMIFYNLGELFQNIAVNKSRREIKKLIEIRPNYANLIKGNETIKINPEEVKIGNLLLIKPGERIPLDGKIKEGKTYIDTFALTGESMPKFIQEGDDVLSGSINKNAAIKLKADKIFSESTVSKILELVENATSKKAETEKFITTFARYYTPVIVAIAFLIAVLPPLFTGELLSTWIYRALVVLVVSCPCALVISIPLGYFGGIGGSSRKGILVKGSNYLDALTNVKTIVFDKTGTLTKGVFKLTKIASNNGYADKDILYYAASVEKNSNHPIAQSIVEAYEDSLGISKNFQELLGYGVQAEVDGKNIILGNDAFLHKEKIEHDICKVDGSVVYVVINNIYAGYLIISDELKETSKKTIEELHQRNIKTILLTGDNDYTANSVASQLNIDEVYSELLPGDKVNILEKIISQKRKNEKVAFVGDGINDAPVIARSDVGFAMGGLGSDAAVEAADIVIMEDEIHKIPEALDIAMKTRKIVWQNIAFAMGVKLIFILLGIMGIATMWEAVFGDMGVAIIAILNSTRMLKG
ncbi:MAG: heavy metal translocating P-type ATPase [Syntrophothermus sp.]